VVVILKKETLEFLNGQRNAVKDEFILGREKAGSSELIFVSLPNGEKPIYALWNSKKTVKKYEKKEDKSGEVVFKKVVSCGTGGESAYVMLIDNMISKLRKKNISLNASGAILQLTNYLEWNTGRLYNKRNKISLTKEMISKILKIGKQKTNNVLKELKELDVLYYNNKESAYFMNMKYVRKGGLLNEDKV